MAKDPCPNVRPCQTDIGVKKSLNSTVGQPAYPLRDELCKLLDSVQRIGNDDWIFSRPASGTSTLVYFAYRKSARDIDTASFDPCSSIETSALRPSYCIRVYDRHIQWQRYRKNLTRLADLGIPSPRLIRSSSLPLFRWSCGPRLILESYLSGPLVNRTTISREVAEQIGFTLARLHNHTAPWFDSGRRRQPVDRFARRTLKSMRNRLDMIRKHAAVMEPTGTSRLMHQLSDIESRTTSLLSNWEPPRQLPLVHTELAGDDMIWLPRGMQSDHKQTERSHDPCVALIDVGAMRHTHPGYDLETISRYLRSAGKNDASGDRGDRSEIMMDAYWKHLLDPVARERHEADRSLSLALYAIPRWSTRMKLAARDSNSRSGCLAEAECLRQELINDTERK